MASIDPANNDDAVGMDIWNCPGCASIWNNAAGAANTAFVATGGVLAAPFVAGAAPGAYAWGVGRYHVYLGAAAGAGAVVLGRYPEFVDVAEESGAQYLNIGAKTFARLENMGVAWQANQAFLNGVINQGARIINASGADRFSWNSYWALELLHLQSRGYQWPF